MSGSFDEVDAEIDELRDAVAQCHRATIASRAAIALSAAILAIVLIALPAYRTPTIILGAIAGMMGGTVWYGANVSSRGEAEAALAAANARKERMIDAIVDSNGWNDASPTLH